MPGHSCNHLIHASAISYSYGHPNQRPDAERQEKASALERTFRKSAKFNPRTGNTLRAIPESKMKSNVSYSLILNKVQADYLSASKYGINRMQALVSLIDLTQTKEETYEKRGFSATVEVGQFIASEVELSRLWRCDRKTVSRVLDQMNQVGLISSVQTNRTSIHTLLCVGSWIIDGVTIKNGHFKRLSER